MYPIRLGVNIDHIATLRQARGTRYPDPLQAAIEAEQAGADLITLHLREDRRHIQERDVLLLKELALTPINLEMAITEDMLTFAEKLRPTAVCLVPEKRAELTTEGGLDVLAQSTQVQQACQRLAAVGIQVSLFINADPAQIDQAVQVGAPVIELHTGHFADASTSGERQAELQRLIQAVNYASAQGLQVHAGHGLNYQNVSSIANIPDIQELNIGHAIISRALFTGLIQAVQDMKRLMQTARYPQLNFAPQD